MFRRALPVCLRPSQCLCFNFSLYGSLNLLLLVHFAISFSLSGLRVSFSCWPSLTLFLFIFHSQSNEHLSSPSFISIPNWWPSPFPTPPVFHPPLLSCWYCTFSPSDDPGIGSVWRGVPLSDTLSPSPSVESKNYFIDFFHSVTAQLKIYTGLFLSACVYLCVELKDVERWPFWLFYGCFLWH